jgi:DNA repair exonuclease SbcCD ATPase subunit
MRLKRIRPHFFRCFGKSDWIDLSSDLVLLYGPNGYGKTSLVEALEWVLHGRAKRRSRGIEQSKVDYKNYYRNIHAPDDETTYVELLVDHPSKGETKIKRVLPPGSDESVSTTYIDGSENPISDLSPVFDSFDPIVPQHSLQDFIRAKPKERHTRISSALGLHDLVKFRDGISNARRRLQQSPPKEVVQAKSAIDNVVAKLSNAPTDNLTDLRSRWVDYDFRIDDDLERVKDVARSHLGTSTESTDDLIEELEEEREVLADQVFDVTPIEPPSDLDSQVQEVERSYHDIPIDEVETKLGDFVAATAAKYSRKYIQFWKRGLSLQSDDSEKCPMCLEETLNEEKRKVLQNRVDSSKTYTKAHSALDEALNDLRSDLQVIRSKLSGLVPNFLNPQARETLESVLENEKASPDEFLSTHDLTQRAISLTKKHLSSLEDNLSRILEKAKDADSLEDLENDLAAIEKEVHQAVESAKNIATNYARSFEELHDSLADVIASDEAIKELDSLLSPLKNWAAALRINTFESILEESYSVEEDAKEFLNKKQKEKLNKKRKDIKKWYSLMNPKTNVEYSRLKTGSEIARLFVQSFGKEINAASSLSQCQANTMGLSLHFIRALGPGSPFSFIVIDDPIQSMDDGHTEAFKIEVVKELLDVRSTQVVILSHSKKLIHGLRKNYIGRDIMNLRIADLDEDGPDIRYAESVKDLVNRADGLASGDEDERRLALKSLRRGVELLIRRVLEKNDCDEPTHEASFWELKSKFKECDATKLSEASALQDTYDFSTSAPHQEAGYAPEIESNISPHLSRLTQFAKEKFDVWKVT